jgi:hypothetical protein
MLATKNDLTIAALIRGIRDVDRARDYIQAEVDLADDEGRDARSDIIGALNRKITSLQGDDTDDTAIDVDTTDGSDEDTDADTGDDGAHDGDDSDDTSSGPTVTAEADYPVFDSRDALEDAVAEHGCGDTSLIAKPDGTKAVCFECEAYIGIVRRDGGEE